ncbi:type 4a pilus biogenesis protein PilO [Gemmatimonas sp.]|uniref:type 4a pilus biogenesis protein PilO n=1 Tax=Gemmatimonas sp. TaxID=1962908 RepID=UPI0027B9E1C3|nr:type 4a pilus biogenesis protein PilO [Gemmatimonas sp.]
MASLPTTQRDQVKLLFGVTAIALAAFYWMYPYTSKNEQLLLDETHVTEIEGANQKAAREFASGSVEALRSQAAQTRSGLTVMRRLVPTGNEVPALLEEVSTAARRAGLDVGGVVPAPVIAGERFDTYRYTVTIIGGYHQFGEFLANVGSLPRIVAPVNFAIVAGSSNAPRGQVRTSEKDALAATITLQTYIEKTAPAPRSQERTS